MMRPEHTPIRISRHNFRSLHRRTPAEKYRLVIGSHSTRRPRIPTCDGAEFIASRRITHTSGKHGEQLRRRRIIAHRPPRPATRWRLSFAVDLLHPRTEPLHRQWLCDQLSFHIEKADRYALLAIELQRNDAGRRPRTRNCDPECDEKAGELGER
jgi:hypothetical protein